MASGSASSVCLEISSCDKPEYVRLCKPWARGGECKHRRCPFRHRVCTASEQARVNRATEQRLADVAANKYAEDPHADGAVANHGGRFGELASWLVATYGAACLNGGAGVLDVAGGRGGLSFQLHCHMDIRCTLLEPRCVELKSHQRRHLKKHPELGCYAHVRARLDESFEATDEGRDLLRHCSVLVGLHSDEATEAIVAAAVKHRKPFAVVPCCVFPNVFSMRRLADGRPVRSYDEFCTWLCEQADGSRMAFLPFEGRNRVVYRTLPMAEAEADATNSLRVYLELTPETSCCGWSRLGVALRLL